MTGETDREFDMRIAREPDARRERERALFGEGDPAPDERLNDVPLRREVHRFPAPGGRLVIEVVPKLGVAPDADWLHHVPARSRLRLSTRWETRFVQPIPERWYEMPLEWVVRMWEGAEPA